MKTHIILIVFFIFLILISCKIQGTKGQEKEDCTYGLLVLNNRYRVPYFYKFDQKKNKFLYHYILYVKTNREIYSYQRIDKPISNFLKEKKIKFENLNEDDRDTLDDYTYIEVNICDTIDVESIAKKEDALIIKEKLFEVLNKKVKHYRIEDIKPKYLRFVNPKEGEKYKRILDSLNASPPSLLDSLI